MKLKVFASEIDKGEEVIILRLGSMNDSLLSANLFMFHLICSLSLSLSLYHPAPSLTSLVLPTQHRIGLNTIQLGMLSR